MTFGERIVHYRKIIGITQKDLAERLEISPTRLNYWEKDKREPDIVMLNKLCAALNVDADILLGRTLPDDKSVNKDKKETPAPDTPGTDRRLNFIIDCYNGMNADGQNRLVEQAEMLKTSGKYDKHSNIQSEMNA